MNKIDDNDIKNLNTEMVYTPEQKAKVQKQFFLLLILFIIIMVILLIYFVFQNDIKNIFKKDEEEQVEEQEPEEKSLYELDDGEIAIENPEIMEMFNIFYLDVNDYFLLDSSKIYKYDFSKLTTAEKLFYMSKTKEFDILVNEEDKYLTKELLCDSDIVIEKESMEKIAKNRFNIEKMQHGDFWTTYAYDNVFLSFLKFKYTNDKYIGTCTDYNKSIVQVLASNIISKAEKEDNYIYIYIKSIFETKNGVYADVNLKNKITSVYSKEELLNYYEKGSYYKLEFKYNGKSDYYFEKMTLINK